MEKKILLLGVNFSDNTGLGVTLKNLFSQYPPRKIGIIDFSVSFAEYKYSNSLFNIRYNNKIINEETIFKSYRVHDYEDDKKRQKWLKYITLYLRKKLVYYYNNYIFVKITSNMKQFVDEFKPEYLYVVPYNRKIINLSLRISKLHNIPIVTHFMDDFSGRSPLDPFFLINEYLTSRIVKLLVKKSYKCLAICESMSIEYERLFDKPFYPFHNPIQTDAFKGQIRIQNKQDPNEIRIVYAGTIAENNYDTITLFSKVCEQLKQEGHKVGFDIFAPQNNSNIFYNYLMTSVEKFSSVAIKEKIDHRQLILTLFSYDLLFMPLSFKQKYRHVIKFSFPTKVSEYMATGIPTLYIIPEGIALHDYVTSNKVGFLIDAPEKETIKLFLLSFIQNPNLAMSNDIAKKIAYTDFDSNLVSSKFKQIFT